MALSDPDPSGAHVAILLAAHEGEAFLPAQLASLAAQTHADWSLIVSDDSPPVPDGPTPTAAAIARFAAGHPGRHILCRPGPRRGFARNFLTLLENAPEAPFVALCDQDDAWFPDKLARAVAALRRLPPGAPGLYCAATVIADADLRPIGPSPAFARPPSFRNALVQSIGGGNTMVLNAAGLARARAALPPDHDPVAHDWWLYQVISGVGGHVLRDPEPVLLYRQHGGNQIGANRSVAARLARIAALLGGRFRDWNDRGLAALEAARPLLTAEAADALRRFHGARTGPLPRRLAALYRSGAVRQGRLGTAALYLACLLRRL